MTIKNHINHFEEGRWARCQNIVLLGGVLNCTLALDQTYDLSAAYKSDLHIRFANATTDSDLIAFLRAWGPLYLPNSQVPQNGTVSLPLSYCRACQRWHRALIDLLNAFKWAERERETLQEFIQAEYGSFAGNSGAPGAPVGEPVALMLLRVNFRIKEEIVEWVKDADLPAVRAATDFLVPLAPVHPFVVNLACRRERKRRYVEASWKFLSLLEALRWMIFYDEFTQHPIICCQDCRTVFRVDSAHARKYCSPECAHRATARTWQREYNRRTRRARRK